MNVTETVRRIVDAGQADARAEIRRDLASPAETLARRNRIALAHEREKTRLSAMCEARATIRKHGIITAAEFLAQLNNLIAATVDKPGSDLSRYRSMLSELAVAIDDDMQGDA